ncbi:ankyrin repeat domain-containing protein 16-like [Amphibalanus amphitrite]|uniref:ankyrin repeat domain-containing protein 16-like n=1 Tax=Amphibalanus amphitrite TaxID=1232801 RepID=UPI001C8FE03A|nr:ankyrin repeat domain-containing protein 16-like [Amphibalanus amphitrite]
MNSVTDNLLRFSQEGQTVKLKEYISNLGPQIIWSECVQLKSKDSCLHLAAREGHVETLKLLLSTGCRMYLEVGNKDGKRPVHEAAHFSHLDCLRALIDAGCDVNALKRADWTPLMLAATRADTGCVTALLAAGALPLLANKDGWTAAQVAARAGHLPVLELLLRAEPRLMETRSRTGRTLLHTAAFAGHEAVVSRLLADPAQSADPADSSGVTPLMDAARAGHPALVSRLLAAGADPARRDRLGRSPLHAAAQTGCVRTARLFAQLVTAPAADGSTPLHAAAREGHMAVCELLLERGARRAARDSHGRTAADVARIHGHTQLAERLDGD